MDDGLVVRETRLTLRLHVITGYSGIFQCRFDLGPLVIQESLAFWALKMVRHSSMVANSISSNTKQRQHFLS
jgi:hypothetical protein